MGHLGKLAVASLGVYSCFLYHGSLQEDVFRYEASDGSRFVYLWMLQAIEAICNVLVGLVGLIITGPTRRVPLHMLAACSCGNVASKYCSSAALSNGLSFPTAVLAKSGKMVPVMAGSILIGGSHFSQREYLQAACIVGGTVAMFLARQQADAPGQTDTLLGAVCIVGSLALDGIISGLQDSMMRASKARGYRLRSYDLMFWLNTFQALYSVSMALVTGELLSCLAYLVDHPLILSSVLKFGLCSALGQTFIFFTLAEFDSVTLAFVTTTRKVCSVLLSIFLKGHCLNLAAWCGVVVVFVGIAGELHGRVTKNHRPTDEAPLVDKAQPTGNGDWAGEYRALRGVVGRTASKGHTGP